MEETVKLHAFLVSNQIDIKGIKSFLDIKPLADSSSELFYGFSGKYQYYCNYGVIVFSGYNEEEMKYGIKTVIPYLKDEVPTWMRDEFQIHETTSSKFQIPAVAIAFFGSDGAPHLDHIAG